VVRKIVEQLDAETIHAQRLVEMEEGQLR